MMPSKCWSHTFEHNGLCDKRPPFMLRSFSIKNQNAICKPFENEDFMFINFCSELSKQIKSFP